MINDIIPYLQQAARMLLRVDDIVQARRQTKEGGAGNAGPQMPEGYEP